MAKPTASIPALTRVSIALAPRLGMLTVFAAVLIGGSFYVPEALPGLILLSVGTTFAFIVLSARFLAGRHRRKERLLQSLTANLIAEDTVAGMLSDPDGLVYFCNAAGRDRLGDVTGRTTASAFADFCANPAVLASRLQNKALAFGAASEDVVCRGGHARVSVHLVGERGCRWRSVGVLVSHRQGTSRPRPGRAIP